MSPRRRRTRIVGGESFEQYLQKQRELSPRTRRQYVQIARRWEEKRLHPIEWLDRLCRRPISRGTLSPYWCAAKHYIAYLGEDPDSYDRPSARLKPKKPRAALNDNELQAYYRAVERSGIPDPVYTILLLLPRTGLRVAELCSARIDGLQQKSGAWGLRVLGKGNKERWIPLNLRARTAIREMERPEEHSPWLFPSPVDAKKPITTTSVRRGIYEIRDQLPGEGRNVTPHMLRHTWATRALGRGVPLRTIQAVLGHSSISVTQLYLHPNAEMLIGAMDDPLDK